MQVYMQEYPCHCCSREKNDTLNMLLYTIYPFFFACHKIVTMGKTCSIFNLRQSFFAISKVSYKRNTGYSFCVFNILRLKRNCEKKTKIGSSQKLQDKRYYEANSSFSCIKLS